MRDIGGLVWLVFVIVAVVSSIARSAKRARGPAAPPQSSTPQRTRITVKVPRSASPQLIDLIQQFEQQAQAHALPAPTPPASPAPPVQAAAATPPPVVQPAPPPLRPIVQEPPRVMRLFDGRDALVRAVVAAEVLGKPLALRDE